MTIILKTDHLFHLQATIAIITTITASAAIVMIIIINANSTHIRNDRKRETHTLLLWFRERHGQHLCYPNIWTLMFIDRLNGWFHGVYGSVIGLIRSMLRLRKSRWSFIARIETWKLAGQANLALLGAHRKIRPTVSRMNYLHNRSFQS